MAKNSYAYLAIGVLVLGIILLCLFLRSTEGFAPAPKVTHSIYLMMPNKGNSLLVDGAGLAVTPPTDKTTNLIVSYGKKQYTLDDYVIYAYGKNCSPVKADPRKFAPIKNKTGDCWYNITIPGTQIKVLTPDGSKALGANGALTGKQMPQTGIIISALSRANCGNPVTTGLPSLPNDKTKLANIRIDLSLSETPVKPITTTR